MSNPLAMPQMIEANGLRFGYHTLGRGPLILMLHGFPDTARAWDPIMPAVAAAGFRVVAPYLRGYAPSQAPASDTTIDDLGRDVVAFLDAFDATSAVVIGHDWGGAAGYAAAALAPDRIERLFTVALPHPAGFKPGINDLWAARHFFSFRLESAPERFVARDFARLHRIYRRWSPTWQLSESDLTDIKRCLSIPESRRAVFGYYRALQRKPVAVMRTTISVPTVAFAGKTDGAVAPRAFASAATRFTGPYEVIELPGGHFPHRENSDLFLTKLLDLI